MANNAFAPVASGKNRFSRRWGGSTTDAVDPYVSGYFFCHFAQLPSKLKESVDKGSIISGLADSTEIAQTLRSSALSVTIPGATMNKAEFVGLGGTKWSVPTNVEWDNTVTVKFLEFSTLPILSIIHGWVRMIRDYRSGVTQLTGSDYTKSNYSGNMYYWTTKPDGKTVEYASLLTGMFPMKDPTDQYGGDLTTVDKLELDIDFNVDYIWHEPWVYDRCQTFADDVYGDQPNIDKYGKDESL